jgi:hypothetical protein
VDWTLFTPILQDLAAAAITAGVGAGVLILKQYTGIQISDAQELSIRRAATTEAGKLMTTGVAVTPANVAANATKIIADLPAEVAATGYTHADIADMIVGSASVAFPPLAAIAPLVKLGEAMGAPSSASKTTSTS